jgi:hypothetical protein
MNHFIAVIIGALAGAHASTWGMYKDSPHEGFTWAKYLRSTWFSAVIALGLSLWMPMDLTNFSNIAVFFAVVYVTERALMEFYKTFLRTEDQDKYFIPMQFHIFGKVVESKSSRLWLGAAYLAGVLGVVYGLIWFQHVDHDLSKWAVILIIGSVGGWISAFGGAWKDAPLEGFHIFKFFRSPLMALFYAIVLGYFSDNYLFISMGGLGYTIASTETYKTFFFPSKPRGKFAGKPIVYPDMLSMRQRFVPLYVLIWIGIIVSFVLGFAGPHEGLLSVG